MARTSDPNSATAQFFINVVNNQVLNYPAHDGHGYAVFGKVVKGMEVVEKIAKLPTEAKPPHQNLPVNTVTIAGARLVGAPAKKSAK